MFSSRLFGCIVGYCTMRRVERRFTLTSLNVMHDGRLKSPLTQADRVPEILRRTRCMVDDRTGEAVDNPSVSLFQEVHESCLLQFIDFARQQNLQIKFGLYDDVQRVYLVTMTHHPIKASSFKRVPGGTNYNLQTTIDVDGVDVDVFNVHFPSDPENRGERLAATRFVAGLAVGNQGPFSMWWKSWFRRVVVAGDWHALPNKGEIEQMQTMTRCGLVDVCSGRWPDEVLEPTNLILRLIFWGAVCFYLSESVLLSVVLCAYLLTNGPGEEREAKKEGTFWGYPVEPEHLQGPQTNARLDRCVVSPGVGVLGFRVLGEHLQTTAECVGLSTVPEETKIPISDHSRICFVGDVGISCFGKVLKMISQLWVN